MTPQQIEQWLVEAGFDLPEHDTHGYDYCKEFERFAAIVAAHEREECAKVCDTFASAEIQPMYYVVAAAAIRARGNNG